MSSASNSDILSQALLQTGLSTPVKVERDSTDFIFPLPPHEKCPSDIQNIVGEPSQLPLTNSSAQQHNLLPSVDSPARNPGIINGGTHNAIVPNISNSQVKQEPYQSSFTNNAGAIPNHCGMNNSSGGLHSNSVYVPMTTSGMASTSGAVRGAQQNYGASNPAIGGDLLVKTELFNDLDMDLSDLLSIPTPECEIQTTSSSNSVSQPHSQFPMTPQVHQQAPFPGPAGSTLEFQPSRTEDNASTDLPVLDDIFSILGDEGDFLDNFGRTSSPSSVNTMFSTPAVPQSQVSRPYYGRAPVPRFPPSSSSTGQFSSLLAMTRDNRHTLTSRGSHLSMIPKRPRFNNNGPVPSPVQNLNIKQVMILTGV